MNACAIVLMIAALSAPGQVTETRAKGPAPQIAEVQKKAIEYARLDPTEISSWKKRVRYSALLPKLQVDYSRKVQNEVNVDVNDSVYVGASGVAIGPEEGSYAENLNADQNVGVKAVWDLSNTVFNQDMLAISEETRLLARERQSILAEVNKNYYERERMAGEIAFLNAQIKRDPHPEKIKQEIFLKRVSLDEATAALDALTGGWFSKALIRDQ